MNEMKARCIAWGSHVVSELQLSPEVVTVNGSKPVLWQRLGAAVIDAVVLFCLFNVANGIRLGGLNLTILLTSYFWIDTVAPICALLSLKIPLTIAGTVVASEPSVFGMMLLSPIFEFCVIWLYHAIMESSSWQATLGKKICGIVVTGVNGERISFGRASLRTFAKCVTFLPYFLIHAITDLTPMTFIPPGLEYPSLIGFAVAFASRRMQGLHDAIAGTLVVPAPQVVNASPGLVNPKPAIVESPAPPAQPQQQADEEMKECPACAEWIKAKAKKCRYCQERFE